MTRLAPILLSLLAFPIASCDGDDGAPSQQDFAEQANGICREAKQSLENVAEDAQSLQDLPDAVDRVIQESRKAVDELADLELPEGEAGEAAQEFVDATRTEIHDVGIPALKQLREAVESRDLETARDAARRLEQIDTGASIAAAREIGANACAKG
jgi:hypothetical protein